MEQFTLYSKVPCLLWDQSAFHVEQTDISKSSWDLLSSMELFFKKFLYLTEKETVREGTQARGVGEGETGFLLSREPDAGLDSRTLGS